MGGSIFSVTAEENRGVGPRSGTRHYVWLLPSLFCYRFRPVRTPEFKPHPTGSLSACRLLEKYISHNTTRRPGLAWDVLNIAVMFMVTRMHIFEKNWVTICFSNLIRLLLSRPWLSPSQKRLWGEQFIQAPILDTFLREQSSVLGPGGLGVSLGQWPQH